MIKEIIANNELSKSVAQLVGNRDLKPSNLKKKEKSLEKWNQLIPAVIADATKALEENLAIVDFESGKPITKEEAPNYIVLVDGNHRYKSWLELQSKGIDIPFYFMYSLNKDAKLSQILTEINTCTDIWKGSDYVKGALLSPNGRKYPLLTLIASYIKEGYSPEAAAGWFTLKETNVCSKNNMIAICNDKLSSIATENIKIEDGNADRGKRLLSAAQEVFDTKFLKSRTLINWVIRKYNRTTDDNKPEFTNKMVAFLKSINEDDANEIMTAKGIRGETTKEDVITKKLNSLYNLYYI